MLFGISGPKSRIMWYWSFLLYETCEIFIQMQNKCLQKFYILKHWQYKTLSSQNIVNTKHYQHKTLSSKNIVNTKHFQHKTLSTQNIVNTKHCQHKMYCYTQFYTAANVHSAIKQLLRIIHTSLAIENSFMWSLVRGTIRLKCLC